MSVQILEGEYTGPDLPDFAEYGFELDHFQKYAVKAIKEHSNVLVTAATGSGKTLVAEYAIKQALASNKKVIYTSPIKSLSNQKFHEFTKKYDTKVGILTGDIKFNPEAQCLIMTTEILRNLLYHKEVVLDAKTGMSLKVDV